MDEMVERLYHTNEASVCFFRTTVKEPNRKCLIQITEKCNFKCRHCFLSADGGGKQLSLEQIDKQVLPFCVENKVTKVTLTGGEPLFHSECISIINRFLNLGINVTVCTNGSLITEELLQKIVDLKKIKFNVSLDAFSQEAFNMFRVNSMLNSFDRILLNIQLLSQYHVLNGILVTPNSYTTIEEYYKLCKFAKEHGAKYVLMNPLSEFGRGSEENGLGYTRDKLILLREKTQKLIDSSFEMVYIRFPNAGKKLSKCEYGKILYLFTNGDVAICPYMVFACNNENSKYEKKDFVLANIFQKNCNLNECLEQYSLPSEKRCTRSDCSDKYKTECSRGCKAIVIANGHYLGECDQEMCTLYNNFLENNQEM